MNADEKPAFGEVVPPWWCAEMCDLLPDEEAEQTPAKPAAPASGEATPQAKAFDLAAGFADWKRRRGLT